MRQSALNPFLFVYSKILFYQLSLLHLHFFVVDLYLEFYFPPTTSKTSVDRVKELTLLDLVYDIANQLFLPNTLSSLSFQYPRLLRLPLPYGLYQFQWCKDYKGELHCVMKDCNWDIEQY